MRGRADTAFASVETVTLAVHLRAPGCRPSGGPWPGPARLLAEGQCQADWAPCLPGARPKRTQRLSAETWGLLRLPLERVSGAQGGRPGRGQRADEAGVMGAERPPPSATPVCPPSPPWGASALSAARDPGAAIRPQRGPHEAPLPPTQPRGPPAMPPWGTSHGPRNLQAPKPPPGHSPQCPSCSPCPPAPCRPRLCPEGSRAVTGRGDQSEAGQGGALGPLCTCRRWVLCSPGGVSSGSSGRAGLCCGCPWGGLWRDKAQGCSVWGQPPSLRASGPLPPP